MRVIAGVEMTAKSRLGRVLLWAIPVAALAALIAIAPIAQPPDYHQFADRRTLLGIPHFANVVTNLAFLLAGGLGLHHCLRHRPRGALAAWTLFFAGFVLVTLGSGYYHLHPTSETLVWDRLTMAVGFTGVYTALMAEYVSARLEKYLLGPVLFFGLASVVYWSFTGDLSFYFAMQATVFLSITVILSCFDSEHRQKRFIIAAFASYALALVCDFMDIPIFNLTDGATGGHAVKHLLAALAAYWAYRMLARRSAQPRASSS